MAFNWILFLVSVRTCCLAGAGISGVSLCARLYPARCILVKVLLLLGKYLSNTSVTFALCRAWKTNFLKASTYTWSLSSGQLMIQSSADISYIMVFWTGQLRSGTVTWSFCFKVDFGFEISPFLRLDWTSMEDMQLTHMPIHHRSLCHVNWQVDQ